MEFGRRGLDRQFGDKEEESTVVTRDRLKGRESDTLVAAWYKLGWQT